MLRVYIETTIPAYLTARPSKAFVVLARQQITAMWWKTQRHRHDLYVSSLVLMEAAGGDAAAAARRSRAIADLPVLDASAEAKHIASKLLAKGCIPPKAEPDAMHVGIAAAHGMDVLLTWNCAHLANAEVLKRVLRIVREMGYEPPQICTPMELMGGKLP